MSLYGAMLLKTYEKRLATMFNYSYYNLQTACNKLSFKE